MSVYTVYCYHVYMYSVFCYVYLVCNVVICTRTFSTLLSCAFLNINLVHSNNTLQWKDIEMMNMCGVCVLCIVRFPHLVL